MNTYVMHLQSSGEHSNPCGLYLLVKGQSQQ